MREARAIHDFTETIELARDYATIELALVRVAGALASAAFVELLLDPGERAGVSATTRLVGWPASALGWTNAEIDALGYPLSLGLWCGEHRRLALQVFEAPAQRRKSRLTPRLVRRLTELCAQAAAAERALPPVAERPVDKNPKPAPETVYTRRSSQRGPEERFIPFPDPSRSVRSGAVHDATYLNAVLPFAIAQASRHQEPLTVLCIEIDRPGSVSSLDPEKTSAAGGKIAEAVSRSLRASDAVVLLDDGRIIVVLPDTSASQAEHVVQVTRSTLSSKHPIIPAETFPFIHVGLASFPVDAQDIASLLDAADQAVDLSKRPLKDPSERRKHRPLPGASFL